MFLRLTICWVACSVNCVCVTIVAMGKKISEPSFAGIRALVMGIGLHGGGVATVRWLLRRGAMVTATDQKGREALAPSLADLRGLPVRYVLGRHDARDFRTHDLIIVNPGVPRESRYLAIAKRAKKRIENDASLFYRAFPNPTIAVTGTRGKTTTTLWIAELLKKKYPEVRPSGNTPERALLKEFDRIGKRHIPAVSELSSWQLEFLPAAGRAPHIAIVTNLYRDHLNRYGGKMEAYADAKANIFLNQEPHDALVLNRDNSWWKYFAKKQPRGQVFFTSMRPLPRGVGGLFVRDGYLILRRDGRERKLCRVERFRHAYGAHNVSNLLAAVLAVKLFDPAITITERDILRLPMPRMRQEIIFQRGRLTIINDSCATSPDGTIAALARFTQLGSETSKFKTSKSGKISQLVLMTGGTDKDLEFGLLAKAITKHIRPEHLILLDGSATVRLQKLLPAPYSSLEREHTLGECVEKALRITKHAKTNMIVLFSPGAASFEKFAHEFDRGEQFNKLVKKIFRT